VPICAGYADVCLCLLQIRLFAAIVAINDLLALAMLCSFALPFTASLSEL